MAALVSFAVACGGASRRASDGDAGAARATSPRLDLAPTRTAIDAPKVSTLPPGATYAWVKPSSMFIGAEGEEDEATPMALDDLRSTAATVLRANGWRETTRDSADFHLVLVSTKRERQHEYFVPDPRNARWQPPRCDLTKKVSCPHVNPPNYPPVRQVEYYVEYRTGYAVKRVADGAVAWWFLGHPAEKSTGDQLARINVELLLRPSA